MILILFKAKTLFGDCLRYKNGTLNDHMYMVIESCQYQWVKQEDSTVKLNIFNDKCKFVMIRILIRKRCFFWYCQIFNYLLRLLEGLKWTLNYVHIQRLQGHKKIFEVQDLAVGIHCVILVGYLTSVPCTCTQLMNRNKA